MVKKIVCVLIAIPLLALELLAACSQRPTPTPTPVTKISREKAIQIVRDGCCFGHLELVGQPEKIDAQLMTLAEADQKTRDGDGYTRFNEPMDTLVWLVHVDGQFQLVGGPAPTHSPAGTSVSITTPGPPFHSACNIFLDSELGLDLLVRC